MFADDDYMKMALAEAELAFKKDEVPVGAVVVSSGRIIAQAHNTPITRHDPSAHTISLNSLPTLKTGNLFGFTSTLSPVFGFLPS